MARIPGTPIAADSPTDPASCWRTPQWLVERIRHDLFAGEIELDPCTTYANPVGAKRIYTPTEEGLLMPWDAKTIFINPPFILCSHFAEKMLLEAQRFGGFAVYLGPAAIGTAWLHDLWQACDDALFLRRRIRFEGVCTFKIGEGDERRTCTLGPDAQIHNPRHPLHHQYIEGSPTRGTALFSVNGTLKPLADLGTRALAA